MVPAKKILYTQVYQKCTFFASGDMYRYTQWRVIHTSKYPEEKDHDESVSKEYEVGKPACDGSLVHKVMERE